MITRTRRSKEKMKGKTKQLQTNKVNLSVKRTSGQFLSTNFICVSIISHPTRAKQKTANFFCSKEKSDDVLLVDHRCIWFSSNSATWFAFEFVPVQWKTNIRQRNRRFRWFQTVRNSSIVHRVHRFGYLIGSFFRRFRCLRWISPIKANIRCWERTKALWHSNVCSDVVATFNNLLIPSIIFTSRSIFRSSSGS